MRSRWMLATAITAGLLSAAGPAAAAPAQSGADAAKAPARPAPVAPLQSRSRTALSTAPSYAGDFPDPFVVQVSNTQGTNYYAYATGSNGSNLQVISSTDLKTWTGPADPLRAVASWELPGRTWAPGVLQTGSGFVMYYTAQQKASGRQCISVATSSTPGGKFTPVGSGPLVCQLDHGGSIDANPFVAPSGVAYLLWKSDDNAIGRTTRLWGQQLSNDGGSLVNAPPPCC